MDLARPYSAVAPGVHGAVLHALHRAAQPLSGRSVAERAGASHEGTRRVLRRLVEHGLVDTLEAGGSILYSLNREHVMADAVRNLAGGRRRLFERMVAEIKTWKPKPLSVTVYGSAARGTGDVGSDIDVFVVRPDGVPDDFSHWDEQLGDLERAIGRWSGNRGEVLDYSLDEVREMALTKVPFVEATAREGVPLFGRGLRSLLLEARRAG